MNDDLKKQLEEFIRLCYSRLEGGDKLYGSNFSKIDLYQEMMEELADIANYAFLEYVKVRNLRNRKNELLTSD